MRFLVINGPNLNLLGVREPGIYGRGTYAELCERVIAWCAEAGILCELFQSNHEGAIVDCIQEAMGRVDGIVINPAAYTHTSVAIPDALKAVDIPTVEVHISKVSEREAFRQVSYVSPVAIRTIEGMGFEGYREAIRHLKKHLEAGA